MPLKYFSMLPEILSGSSSASKSFSDAPDIFLSSHTSGEERHQVNKNGLHPKELDHNGISEGEVNEAAERYEKDCDDFVENESCGPSAEKDDADAEFHAEEDRAFSIPSLGVLRRNVLDNCDDELRQLLKASSFVVCPDYRHMLIKRADTVYICDLRHFCKEYFYQVLINDLGRIAVMNLLEPVPLRLLFNCALAAASSASQVEELSERLMSNAAVLEDYFSIKIDDSGNLLSIPWLLEKYYPLKTNLPKYFLRLAKDVPWNEELACIDSICRETAEFYSKCDENPSMSTSEWNSLAELVIFPALRDHLFPSKNLFSNHFTEILNLLYVDRC